MGTSFVTGQITTSGASLPTENILPAPGRIGEITIVNNSASNTATLTAPGSGDFVLSPGQVIRLALGGTKLVVTGTTPLVSYAYAARGN